jgi:Fe-S cluster assembly iron-binding protein IscA
VTEPAPRLLAITASALLRIQDFRAAEPDATDRMLSVRVTGEADGQYVYALSLEPVAKIRAGDAVQHEGDLAIVVGGESVEKLRGATMTCFIPASSSSTPTGRHPGPSFFPPSR